MSSKSLQIKKRERISPCIVCLQTLCQSQKDLYGKSAIKTANKKFKLRCFTAFKKTRTNQYLHITFVNVDLLHCNKHCFKETHSLYWKTYVLYKKTIQSAITPRLNYLLLPTLFISSLYGPLQSYVEDISVLFVSSLVIIFSKTEVSTPLIINSLHFILVFMSLNETFVLYYLSL